MIESEDGPRCPACRGLPVVTEMGCFGPKSFGRCKTCHGSGDAVLCVLCKPEGGMRFATQMYQHWPICDEHANVKCRHGTVKGLPCLVCASNERDANQRANVFEEAAEVCRKAGERREQEMKGRDYDAFSEGARAACFGLAHELGEEAWAVRDKLKKESA